MYAFIFRNKLAALLFVGAILFGVANLVGTEDRQGLLQQGVDSFEDEKASFGERAGALSAADDDPFGDNSEPTPDSPFSGSSQDDSTFFDDDSDLIDQAAGFDPSPDSDEFSAESDGEIIGTLAPVPPEPELRGTRGSDAGDSDNSQPNNGLITAQEAGRLEERLAEGR